MKRIGYENSGLDRADAAILASLAANARESTAQIARAVGLSAPAVAERIRRLEEAGVITGYAAQIDPRALGRPLAVLLRIRPVPGELKRVAALLVDLPEITECVRVTGEDCFVARAYVRSVEELEALIDRLNPWSMTTTSIIQSSPVAPRLPPILVEGEAV